LRRGRLDHAHAGRHRRHDAGDAAGEHRRRLLPPMARLSRLSRSIEGKVALVTGSASGMGRATAYLFADEGARVAVADLGADRVAAVVAEIEEAGGEAAGFEADVSSPDAVRRLVSGVVDRFGGLDILVNNAGVSFVAGSDASDDEFEHAWRHTFDVN